MWFYCMIKLKIPEFKPTSRKQRHGLLVVTLYGDEQKIKHIHLWALEIVSYGSWRNVQTTKTDTELEVWRKDPHRRFQQLQEPDNPKRPSLEQHMHQPGQTFLCTQTATRMVHGIYWVPKPAAAGRTDSHCAISCSVPSLMSRHNQSFNPASRWPFQNSVFLLPINFVSLFQAPEIVNKDE